MGLVLGASASLSAQTAKPKLLVLTDMGGDPDDQQSMVRLMAYNNEFEIIGLIATSAMGHGQSTYPDYIRNIVNAYGQSQANFSVHANGYASASQLLSVVKSGTGAYNPGQLSQVIGVGKSTEGSNHIISVVDAATDGRPVNIVVWGGAADLAQALHDVRETRTPSQVQQFVSRIRVNAIADQDGTGAWINTNFPELAYILSSDVKAPNGSTLSQSASFRGMYQNSTRADNGSGGRQVVPSDQLGLTKSAWIQANIDGHGPLGDVYPYQSGIWQGPTGGNFPNNSATSGMKEGDTPSWLFYLPNGLSNPDEPSWGGWGGRFVESAGNENLLLNARDAHYSGRTDVALETVWTVARFRQAVQNDFAARMDWAVAASYELANHAPVSPLEGLYSYTSMTVAPDQTLTLSGAGWTDPDGNALSYRWWFYADASTPGVTPTLLDPDARDLALVLPDVTSLSQLHLILEVTDVPAAGGVPMTRYQRTLLTIDPAYVPEPGAGAMTITALVLAFRRNRPRAVKAEPGTSA